MYGPLSVHTPLRLLSGTPFNEGFVRQYLSGCTRHFGLSSPYFATEAELSFLRNVGRRLLDRSGSVSEAAGHSLTPKPKLKLRRPLHVPYPPSNAGMINLDTLAPEAVEQLFHRHPSPAMVSSGDISGLHYADFGVRWDALADLSYQYPTGDREDAVFDVSKACRSAFDQGSSEEQPSHASSHRLRFSPATIRNAIRSYCMHYGLSSPLWVSESIAKRLNLAQKTSTGSDAIPPPLKLEKAHPLYSLDDVDESAVPELKLALDLLLEEHRKGREGSLLDPVACFDDQHRFVNPSYASEWGYEMVEIVQLASEPATRGRSGGTPPSASSGIGKDSVKARWRVRCESLSSAPLGLNALPSATQGYLENLAAAEAEGITRPLHGTTWTGQGGSLSSREPSPIEFSL